MPSIRNVFADTNLNLIDPASNLQLLLFLLLMIYPILVIGAFCIAILSTLSGGGASLILMPLIAFTIGVKSVAPIMTISIAMSSSSRVVLFFKSIDWRLFSWLFPSTVIGSFLGAKSFSALSSDYLQVLIGLFLVFTVVQFFQKAPSPGNSSIKAWHFMPIGFVISYLSGLIGGVGPLMNSAFLNYGMTKESLIGTRSANAVLLHLTKILSYGYFGFVTGEVLKFGIILGLSSIIGNIFGKRLLLRISYSVFRTIVIVTMVVSGVLMLIKQREAIDELLVKFF